MNECDYSPSDTRRPSEDRLNLPPRRVARLGDVECSKRARHGAKQGRERNFLTRARTV